MKDLPFDVVAGSFVEGGLVRFMCKRVAKGEKMDEALLHVEECMVNERKTTL